MSYNQEWGLAKWAEIRRKQIEENLEKKKAQKKPKSKPKISLFDLSPKEEDFLPTYDAEEELKKYVDDEDCGFMLTASAYREMISVIEQLRGKDGIVRLPDIPIYILDGSEDQRGNCGNSVMRIANMLSAKGHNEVSYKLYKDCYHDILHDICNADYHPYKVVNEQVTDYLRAGTLLKNIDVIR